MKDTTKRRVDEQLRRVSARVTKGIAARSGVHYGMYLASGYPKSGTSWLGQLMGTYLDLPHPQNYSMPIAMASVLQNHWLYDERFPKSAYVCRDGRDILVSLYFYQMRSITQPRHPRQAARLDERFKRYLGANYDPNDVAANIGRFVEAEFVDPVAVRGVSWGDHVRSWCAEDHSNVVVTRYEDLLGDPQAEFGRLMAGLTGAPADEARVQRALSAHDFAGSGRKPGQEDRSSFMRKGISGDWRNHFTSHAAQAFEEHAGAMLRRLGYEEDTSWHLHLEA
ncbi:sulfotransferase domain-containing protein [Nocardioides jejuensis]|uniref:Sulfotransferase domain-containing protein n=1 Tax=Nocardioides jejuensis TaxID=2502782 RepID=A0A4R1CJN1_9ACTN|nr:sulfotransferase domain-containing protein [Nocardioides jejuensis]TCJ30208.1 hypothetical protein EPD65_04810 [Nocardioides jejuensis]